MTDGYSGRSLSFRVDKGRWEGSVESGEKWSWMSDGQRKKAEDYFGKMAAYYTKVTSEEMVIHGGRREGAGRKKISGGVRHMWTVPPDIDQAVRERGTQWLWDIARTILAYDQKKNT